jgi:cytoskeletal protein CcmA (bactofilin family)
MFNLNQKAMTQHRNQEVRFMSRMRRVKPPKVVTVIGQGTTVEGHVRFSGALHLDGKIKGEVTAEPETNAALIISEQGVIEGDVKVEQLITDGSIVGDVHARDRVELGAHARIAGTLYYQLLEMAMGAEVNGKLVHCDSAELQRLSYDGHYFEETVTLKERPSASPDASNSAQGSAAPAEDDSADNKNAGNSRSRRASAKPATEST